VDAHAVTAASFTTVSRNHPWAEDRGRSYTWFEVSLCRPGGGRSDLRAIRVHHNHVRSPELEFYTETTRWDTRHPHLGSTTWLRSLRPGDIIQVIPKAVYRQWANIVRDATIKIEYQPMSLLGARSTLLIHSQAIPTCYYHPLECAAGRQQIRLLEVKPGKYDEPIQAQFVHVSLGGPGDEQSEFAALSYC
jgi:hypothetical protein